MADVYAETLKRAAEIVGGEEQLAWTLKVTPSHLRLWIEGVSKPPMDVFLRAVDLVQAAVHPPNRDNASDKNGAA